MTSDLPDVISFRKRASKNGFDLIRLRTGEKVPAGKLWGKGEALDLLLLPDPACANTGMLCGGWRVVDVDCDDRAVVTKVMAIAGRHFQRGGMFRRRSNSPRLAMLLRSADGLQPKLVVRGAAGKVEVLGAGQQLMVHGVHPSGATIEWYDNRSPANTPSHEIPCVQEIAVNRFLQEVGEALGAAGVTTQGNSLPPVPARWAGLASSNGDLSGGVEASWFDHLRPIEKRQVVQLSLAAIDNSVNDDRDRWLKVLFAVADAGRRGIPDARALALEWSRGGAGWTSQPDFDLAWNSYKPGGVGVGTLLHLGNKAGADLSGFRGMANPLGTTISAASATPGKSPLAAPSVALSVGQLPVVPPKRKWLHGTDLVRGAVSLMVAPGGRGKSTWLLTLGLACASGKPLLGANVFGAPLRVLYISVEDPSSELARRTRAAMQHHGLSDADLGTLRLIGADQAQFPLMTADKGVPRLDQIGLAKLRGEIDHVKPDVLIIDPLVSLMGAVSLNDNSAAALLQGELVRLAATCDLALILAHHSAKFRETNSADAAMGAATFVNLARVSLSLESVSEADAHKIGVAPWDVKMILRLIGTKQNLSPPTATDRYYRLASVTLANAQPPIYPNGDVVGVIEQFTPSLANTVYPQAIVAAVMAAVANANPPLSPAGRNSGVSLVAAAVAPLRGGQTSNTEAKAIIDYLIRQGMIAVSDVTVPRAGHGSYSRKGLTVVAPLGPHQRPNLASVAALVTGGAQ